MESKQSDMIKTALDSVKSMVDANTVTGTPIKTESGTVIIPVSKLFVGLASGGIDYVSKRAENASNFGGGGGTGVTVAPVGFLVIDKDGKVDFLGVNDGPKDTVGYIIDLIESTPEIVEKFKKLFAPKKKEEAEK